MKKDFYIVLAIIYLEIIYHIFAFYDINIIGPVLSCLFISFILIFIKNLFNKKVNKIIFYTLFFIITFIYELQFIYYKMLGFVCSVASLTMAGDAVTGYENIINYIIKNWYSFLLLLLPFILLIIFNKKIDFERKINYKKDRWKSLFFIPVVIVVYFLCSLPNRLWQPDDDPYVLTAVMTPLSDILATHYGDYDEKITDDLEVINDWIPVEEICETTVSHRLSL